MLPPLGTACNQTELEIHLSEGLVATLVIS